MMPILSRISLECRQLPLTAWLLLAVLLAFLTPVFSVFSSLFAGFSSASWQHLLDTVLAQYVVNSLYLVMGVAVGVSIIGVTSAWLVARCEFIGRKLFAWLLVLPLAMPAYIIAYTYTGMLDFSGPLQSALRAAFGWSYGDYFFPEIKSLGGAICMMSLVLYPYVYLLARRAFASQSASLFEAAQLSGLSAQQQFFRLSLPMARPAIIAGMALALMETLADYGTVEYFGIDVFSTGIFRTWFGLGDATAASQLASILLIAVIALLCLEKMHRRKAAFVQGQAKLVQRISLKPFSQALAISFCVSVISLGFLLPFIQLSYWTFWQNTAPFNQAFWQLSFNSLLLAALTAMAAIVLAVAFSYLQRFMRDNPISNAMVFLAGLGYALPGTIIAIGVMIPFTMLDKGLNAISESLFSVSPGLIFSGSLFILVFAYLIRFLPIALGSLQTAMQTIDPALDDAAQNLGETKPRIIAKVHLPLIKSSLFAAALLVFVDTLKELPATLALRPFNFNTLAVRSFELANDERLAAAAPAVIMIVLAGLLPVILLNASIHQSEKNNA